MRLATIDIGTNTTLLLVAEATSAGVTVLADEAEVTRLGRGIGGDGKLDPERIRATLAVLERYAALAQKHHAPLRAVGTEALRAAPNAADFLLPAQQILGVPVEVIEGEREAALSFLAVARSFPDQTAQGTLVVVDIGGGSTEIILSRQGAVVARTSIPIGAVRLTERHLRADPPTTSEIAALEQDIEARLAAAPRPNLGEAVTLVGTAGTVTTVAAMTLALPRYDAQRIHGMTLSVTQLDQQIARLALAPLDARKTFAGLDPRRADVIFAGAKILRAVARQIGAETLLVSDRGVRWGLWWDSADKNAPRMA